MKLLFLDIETGPNTAHIWGLWNQNIGINQLLESSRTLCWAAKWEGEDELIFSSEHQTSHRRMIKKIHTLLHKADVVCHYNGTKFDIPTLQKEFLKYNLPPPAPFKQIDLLRTARNQFRFPSNKLDYVANALGLGKKRKHEGHELWVKCLAGNAAAWETMEDYNKQDVTLLESVYTRFRPWIKNAPNRQHYDRTAVCPDCGGTHYWRRGYANTATGKYPRYQCLNETCGGWFQSLTPIEKYPVQGRTKKAK
jgi:hypothetical protein